MAEDLVVDIEPAGFGAEVTDRLLEIVPGLPRVRELVQGGEYRVLDIQPLERSRRKSRGRVEESFRATVYDYANQRTLEVVGDVDAPEHAEVQEFARQPLPSSEEF
jgi:hypothetical protein